MACFLVPATEAVITTAVTKAVEKKEESHKNTEETAHTFVPKLKWLNEMLWGGSALLMLEHVWHGELVPYFPFLTAAVDKADTIAMLQEMATAGVGMAVLVTAVWGGMVAVSHMLEKREQKEQKKAEE